MENPVERDVLSAIKQRYSAYRYLPRGVEDEKLLTCLEAARWAASSFNDQPWSWIIARREDDEAFERMLGVLAEPNRGWARDAGVLLIGLTRTNFRYNGSPNRVALHDLGAAAALMALQAAELGLSVHQMAGLDRAAAAETYGVPEGHEVQTALAIGYPDESEPEGEDAQALRARVLGARERLALKEQVFGRQFGVAADVVA